MKQSTFYVADLCCPTEEGIIRNRLKSIDGITTMDFNVMQRQLTITHRLPDETPLIVALDSLGMGARLKTAAPDAETFDDGEEHAHSSPVSVATKVLFRSLRGGGAGRRSGRVDGVQRNLGASVRSCVAVHRSWWA